MRAQLGRTSPTKAALGDPDGPFARRLAPSPARPDATQVVFASEAAADATAAYTAYACDTTKAPIGFGLPHAADGGVWTPPTGTLSSWTTPTATTLTAAYDAPVLLQRGVAPLSAANATVTADVPGVGNISWPSAAVLALCAPYIADALANYNVSAPLASIEARLQNSVKSNLFGALGPVGGSIVIATAGTFGLACTAALGAWTLRRRQASAPPIGGNGPPGAAATPGNQGGDAAADASAIALSPLRTGVLAGADALATPLKAPTDYRPLRAGTNDVLTLAPSLAYGGGGLASPTSTAPSTPKAESSSVVSTWGPGPTVGAPASTASTGSVAAARSVAPTGSSPDAPGVVRSLDAAAPAWPTSTDPARPAVRALASARRTTLRTGGPRPTLFPATTSGSGGTGAGTSLPPLTPPYGAARGALPAPEASLRARLPQAQPSAPPAAAPPDLLSRYYR